MYLFGPRFSLDICPGVELLNHLATLFFNFLSSLHTILHSGYTNLHILQQHRRVPISPHPLHHLYVVFNDDHSDQCEVVSHYSFDLYFSDN